MGAGVVNLVKEWWDANINIARVNKTYIVLIPKCNETKRMSDFQPISLCNVAYKIILKVMANKLKIILPDLISFHQSAFILR